MIERNELSTEKSQDEVLCGKSDKISMDIPSQNATLCFDYAEYEKSARVQDLRQQERGGGMTDISKFLLVQTGSHALMEQRAAVLKELARFRRENADLALDARFADAYYFRLAEFHSLIQDYEKATECLAHIQDRENGAYAAKIAESELRKSERTEENLALLYRLNTAETARKLSGWYLANNDVESAEKAICHYMDEHDEIPYEVYFQYAFLFMRQGNADRAIHFLRRAFYARNTAQSALALSMLYLVKATRWPRLIKKARLWCGIAVHFDVSFVPALRLFVNLALDAEPEKTERILSRYLELNTAHTSDFYFDAAVSHAECAFVRKKYGEALERLQSLIDDGTKPAAVWNNIALCNVGAGNYERAERNIARALEKLGAQETGAEKSRQLKIILTNYMKILNAQGKYGKTLALFERTPGAKDITLTEESYLHYFAEWRNALLAAGDYTTSFDFLTAVFTSDDRSPVLRLFACNDLLRLCTLTGQNADMAHQCLNFLKQFYADCPRGKHTVQTVNNIVFASLELGEVVSPGILQDFIPTIGRHPCNTATYGLYLMRTKHDMARGLAYYDKAIAMARGNPAFSYLTEELDVKKDMEAAKLFMEQGDTQSARRLLKRLEKLVSRTLPQAYQQAAARLLAK